MDKPKTAILDGDIIAYRIAYWAETEGIDEVPHRIVTDFEQWTPADVDNIIVALSCPREKNYRRDFWPLYKKHRDKTPVPDSMAYTIESIYDTQSHDGVLVRCVNRLEADDLIGMMVSSGKAIGVTIDKDLRQVPGWHLNPDKEQDPIFVSEEEGDRFFYKQWMSGDSTDNIPGLWRVGPKKAEKVLVDTPRDEWEEKILDMYRNETRPETKQVDMSPEEFALAMARCVRILRKDEYDKHSKEVTLWNPIVGLGINKP